MYYISNGRRFTKSALRILLLSTFRVSSINYSLVCSLPIHTRSSANAEGPRAYCQLKSCIMLYKCLTYCKYISVLHRFRDINTYFAKNLDVTWPWPRPVGLQFVISLVCNHKTNSSWANPCTKFHDFIFSHFREIYGA